MTHFLFLWPTTGDILPVSCFSGLFSMTFSPKSVIFELEGLKNLHFVYSVKEGDIFHEGQIYFRDRVSSKERGLYYCQVDLD